MLPRVNSSAAAEHLAAALRFKTTVVSPDGPVPKAELQGLRDYLAKTFPLAHQHLGVELINDSLLFTWKPAQPSKEGALLLLAHMDVVPIEPGTETKWTHPPFAGVIDNDLIYGRGAIDDKARLVGTLEAVESMLAAGVTPKRTVYLCFGSDEEVGGAQGSQVIAKTLQARGVKLDIVLDEAGAVTQGVNPNVAKPIASIGVAEKGYVSFELTANGPPGHAAFPAKNTAIAVLSKVIDDLNTRQMPARMTPLFRETLKALGPHMPWPQRLAVRAGKLGEWLLLRTMDKTPTTAAQIRTTFAPTILKSGIKDNLVPSMATAVVNFRILPGETVADVEAHVKRAIGDAKVNVKTLAGEHSPPRVSSSVDAGFLAMAEAVRATFGEDVVIAPTLVAGVTDSRHFDAIATNTYRFTPVRLSARDVATIHGTDEKISVNAFADLVRFYQRIITKLAV